MGRTRGGDKRGPAAVLRTAPAYSFGSSPAPPMTGAPLVSRAVRAWAVWPLATTLVYTGMPFSCPQKATISPGNASRPPTTARAGDPGPGPGTYFAAAVVRRPAGHSAVSTCASAPAATIRMRPAGPRGGSETPGPGERARPRARVCVGGPALP
jgi:hypothetical protein